ncbi:MAG: hypothetical protein MZV64_00345 [Ignavibacteriales bacterium]|nr:hypothetical protein [Ignavibacteriales bacterium]
MDDRTALWRTGASRAHQRAERHRRQRPARQEAKKGGLMEWLGDLLDD